MHIRFLSTIKDLGIIMIKLSCNMQQITAAACGATLRVCLCLFHPEKQGLTILTII